MSIDLRCGDALALKDHKRRRFKPFWDREWLRREYEDRGRSASDIAGDFGCHGNNVLYFLAKHGIVRRNVSQARAIKRWGVFGAANPMFGRTGALSPNWRGGTTPERQSEYARARWRATRRFVWKRSGGRCEACGAGGLAPRVLHVHHIKPWAEYPSLRHAPENLVLLCRECHHDRHRKVVV
jgi:hypothetical protein